MVAVSLAVAGGAASVALQSQPYLAFMAILATLGMVGYFGRSLIKYAEKYPNHAVMDGAQFVRYTEVTQAAKDSSIVVDGTVLVANNAPPKALTSARDDE